MASTRTFGVCGAGTMGSGIAYAAALVGYDVWLYDIADEMLDRGRASIASYLASGVERGRISQEDADAVSARVRTTARLEDLADCTVVVEAILERLDAKQDLFVRLESIVADDAILASNTSSLPITAIAGALARPERCVGMHFFNPAHIMKLVEVIEGYRTSSEILERTIAIVTELGKTPVRARDTPGFIVNRVARNFYGEAFRIVGEGAATHEQVDRCMRAIGFKMGPYELMDLIGIDVNLMVTRSVHDLYFGESRFRPHLIQQKMVESGRLGKKSGGGFYASPTPPSAERP
ncbi:MAG TPA: 3-hydroxyacyl-CoA dehydrogenase NAD-binding domain-containing protein [Candidatus Kapabacteria bacterium]|nr:3-hydroxyacyl-CoA dehydrogenase NAD-binding domain-containing protein [Candidatus Kapabacteria bacterium]